MIGDIGKLSDDASCYVEALNLVARKFIRYGDLEIMSLPDMIDLYAVIHMNQDYKTAYDEYWKEINKLKNKS